MEEIDIKSAFGPHLKKLLEDPKYCKIPIMHRGFCIPEKIPTEAILFIGINPSFDEREEQCAMENYYCLNQIGNYRFFKKFEDISKRSSCIWTHIDLTFFRETNQNFVDQLMALPNGLDFIYQQLSISKKIIEISRPKVIVVANTKSRLFLGKEKYEEKNEWMNFSFEFDDEIGTDRITSKDSELYGTPVFFTSMLTGQRALDRGSFERLCWHISRVIKIII